MKVLVLTTTFPRWKDDVRPPFVYELSRGLQNQGFDVVVLAPHCEGAKKFEIMDGMKVYRFKYFFPVKYQKLAYGPGVLPNIKNSMLAKLQIPAFLISELYSAIAIIKREKIDMINSHWILPHGLIGIICKTIYKIPHITSVHGSDINTAKNSAILSNICRIIIDRSDKVTVNSSYTKKIVLNMDPKAVPKVGVIPMGVDTSVFNPNNKNGIRERYHAKYLIFSIGRLIDWKGMDYLIKAMPEVVKRFPGAKLIIGGSGPEKVKLEKLIRELELTDDVFLAGYIENIDLPKYYASSDIFVLPSIELHGQTEALSVVLLEAMASGCPVIGTDVGGIPDIIQDDFNGLLVKEKSPEDISSNIIKLLSNDKARYIFISNGLSIVEKKFEWQKIIKQFRDEIVNAKGNN